MKKDTRVCEYCGHRGAHTMGICVFCGKVACDRCGARELTYEMGKIIAHADCYVEKIPMLTRAYRFLHSHH